jgi:hypothetical protein
MVVIVFRGGPKNGMTLTAETGPPTYSFPTRAVGRELIYERTNETKAGQLVYRVRVG